MVKTPVVGEINAATLENITVTSGNTTDVGTIYGIGRPSLSEAIDDIDNDEGSPIMYMLLGIIVVIVAIVIVALIVLVKKGKTPKNKDTPPEEPLQKF